MAKEDALNPDKNSVDESTRKELELVTTLDETLFESSGLLILDETMITHNDSGGQPALYMIDKQTGIIVDQIQIDNSFNRDWEDIARDSDHIYIGDFGNNNGDRDDLTIYKIRIGDITHRESNSVPAEKIEFSYSDQNNFDAAPYGTKYDAEALISVGDSLFIFTKNWTANRTYIYSLPKEPGSYLASIVDSLNVPGLVTAADYDPSSQKIWLLGYGFIAEIQKGDSGNFSKGRTVLYSVSVPSGNSGQTEGVFYSGKKLYISAEAFSGASPALYRLNMND